MYAAWMGGAAAASKSVAADVEALRAENGAYRIFTPEQAVAARLLAAREPAALLRAAAVREAAAPQLLPLLLTHALARPTLSLLAQGALGGGDAPAPAPREP